MRGSTLRILLDENIPDAVRLLIAEHEVQSTVEIGLSGVGNGELIAAAEAEGYAVLITADQSIRYQQNLSARRIALVVLSTNHWPSIKADPSELIAAVETIEAGQYLGIAVKRLGRRRPS
jgi:hypothetical protein